MLGLKQRGAPCGILSEGDREPRRRFFSWVRRRCHLKKSR